MTMDKGNEVKGKIKKVLGKMIRIQTVIFIILISLALSYYTSQFYKNKALVFGVADTKLLLGLVIMFVWVMIFSVYLMIELNHKDKIIINQNNIIINKNETIEKLLNKVIDKTNIIEENTEDIMEQNEENFDQIMESSKSTREILLDDRSDKIA